MDSGIWLGVDLDSGAVVDMAGVRLVHTSALSRSDWQHIENGARSEAAQVGAARGVDLSSLLGSVRPVPSVPVVISVSIVRDRFGNSRHVGHVVNASTGEIAAIPESYGHGRADIVASAAHALAFDSSDFLLEGARVVVIVADTDGGVVL